MHSAERAETLLRDPCFVREWTQLHAACPWATVFQTPAFALTWYDVYREEFEPLVVHERNATAVLRGLFLLCRSKATGTIGYVGLHQAEYQGWLALPDGANNFMGDALRSLAPILKGRTLRLTYLPPGTPTTWSEIPASRHVRIVLRSHRRGLMRVGPGSQVEASLHKRGNRNRIARLRRLGAVEFAQLHTVDELDRVLDTIALHCDVRHGAVHATLPFRSDPLKRAFYRALMAKPGLTHATVLFAGPHLVASHIGLSDPKGIALNLLTLSPVLAAYSPGKLLMLYLGRLLGEQGYTEVDLTPGDADVYKERFATHCDQVVDAEIFFGRVAHLAEEAHRAAVAIGRRAAIILHLDVAGALRRASVVGSRLKRVPARQLPTFIVARTGRALWHWLREDREVRLYRIPVTGREQPRPEGLFAVNKLDDLLAYEPPSPAYPSLSEFLAAAVKRLEEGQVVFTRSERGLLLHYSWLIPSATTYGTDYGHEIDAPEQPAVLWDSFTHPSARGRGLHQASLAERLDYVAREGFAAVAVTAVRADNVSSRHNVERAGFMHYGSAWLSVRKGHRRRWLSGVDRARG
ncbi:MAG: hypothetical protein NVS4B3_12370 [Gemmatimonadaceae bacterium]